jgi:predicted amidophosphoribosyltransferase
MKTKAVLLLVIIFLAGCAYAPPAQRTSNPQTTVEMLCPECGRDIPPDSSFCPKCGHDLGQAEPVPSQDGMDQQDAFGQ